MSRLGAGIRDDRGVTLVEFALVVPVVLILLISCIDFARVLNASVTIQNASREAARYATLHPQGSAETSAAYATRIHDYVADRVVPLDAALMTVAITASVPTDPRCAALAPTSCAWASGQPQPTRVTVRASYPWTATTWLIGPMLFTATRTSSLEASASMESMQ